MTKYIDLFRKVVISIIILAICSTPYMGVLVSILSIIESREDDDERLYAISSVGLVLSFTLTIYIAIEY